MTDMTPGWQPDPTGRHDHRYWDGSRWTDDVADAGVAAKDPFDGPTTPAAGDAPADDPAPTQPEAPVAQEPVSQDPAPTIAAPLPPQDPTAAWPATGATPPPAGGFGAPPPPASPTPPAAAAASGGSKKGFLIGLGVLVLIALGVGAFLLLGDDDDDGPDRASIRAAMISQLNADGFLSDERAGCVADGIIDELGLERLEGVDFSAPEPPPGLEDDFFAAYEDALADCRETGSDGGFGGDDGDDGSDEGTDDGATDGTTDDIDDGFGDDGLSDDGDDFGSDFGSDLGSDFGTDDVLGPEFEEMLAEIYADTFDLSQDKAECLAGKIADAMGSGDLDESEMMGDIFSYFDDCDISMSELGGAAN